MIKDKKLVQERVKIPAYGDDKIEDAKGKLLSKLFRQQLVLTLTILHTFIGILE